MVVVHVLSVHATQLCYEVGTARVQEVGTARVQSDMPRYHHLEGLLDDTRDDLLCAFYVVLAVTEIALGARQPQQMRPAALDDNLDAARGLAGSLEAVQPLR